VIEESQSFLFNSTIVAIFVTSIKIIIMISYKIVALADHISSEEVQYKYYPRICNRKSMDLRLLSKKISQQSSVTESDVYAVLHSFIYNIPDLLMNNYSIKLEDFGIFSLHAKAQGCATENEVRAKHITQLNMAFRPSTRIKKALRRAEFRKVK